MTLLRWLVYFTALMYLGAPLVIYLTQRQPADPRLDPLSDPASPALAPLAEATQALQALGFDLIGYFTVSLAGGTQTVLAYLFHRGNGDAAIVARIASPLIMVSLTEFATRFADGSAVTTGNSKVLGAYRRPKNKPVYHFPGEQDVAKLYRYHQLLLLRDRGGMKKDIPAPGAEVERLLDGMRREMADQVPAGILRSDGNSYRPTLLGAYYMTWKLLFPIKQVRKLLRGRRARTLARQLDQGLVSAASVG